jgi:hypothetical protein
MHGHDGDRTRGRARPVRRAGRLAGLALAGLLALPGTSPGALPDTTAAGPLESQVKAAFLYRFTEYAEWPARPEPDAPFVFGVVGPSPVEGALRAALSGKTWNSRPCVVRAVENAQDLSGCQVVFVAASQVRRASEWLAAVRGSAVLVVGESAGFAAAGGTIGFFSEAGRLRFEINPGAAARAHLRLSSRLLDLAVIVHDARH